MIPFQKIIHDTAQTLKEGELVITEHAEKRLEERNLTIDAFKDYEETLLGLCLNNPDQDMYKSWHERKEGNDIVIIYRLKPNTVEIITAYESDLKR